MAVNYLYKEHLIDQQAKAEEEMLKSLKRGIILWTIPWWCTTLI